MSVLNSLAAHLCFLFCVRVVWCVQFYQLPVGFLIFHHCEYWCACVSGREGGGSGLWGMLGDFNNAEAVQWDLIKEDDVITEPWLWATFPHSNIRSLSFSLAHTHTHTQHQPLQLYVHVWFTYWLPIYTKMHQSLWDKPRNYDSKCLIM